MRWNGPQYRSGLWISGPHFVRDLRFAIRVLSKDAKFSVLAVLGLALGIGVSTAIVSLVNTVFGLGTEEVRNAASYVGLDHRGRQSDFSFPEYRYFQDHATALVEISAESAPFNFVLGAISARADSEEVVVRFESSSSLSVRRLQPALGRSFSKEEEQAGGPPAAILSHRLWQRRFAGDRSIVGKAIVLNAHAVTIVGVADSQFRKDDRSMLFLPLGLQPLLLDRGNWLDDSEVTWLTITARLRPGITLSQAQSEADVLGKAFDQSSANSRPASAGPASPADRGVLLSVGGVNPLKRRTADTAAFAICLAVSMVLLIACSNLASLLLARSAARRREIGIRISLGASRARVICQLLTESLLLAIAGGALGLVLSSWLAKWLFISFSLRAGTELHSDYRALLYGFALSFVTGLSFGFGPALAATKTDPARALHAEGLAGTPGSRSLKMWSLRNLLVVVPLAASLMLLTGAALMVRSVQRAHSTGPAFDTSCVIGMSFRLKAQGYDEAKTLQFHEHLRERLRAMPGVTSVASATVLPLTPPTGTGVCQLQIEGSVASTGGRQFTVCNVVSVGFFHTLGVPPVHGREFSSFDREGSVPVAMVNQALARRDWPNQDPIGKHIRSGSGRVLFEVVGVASDLEGTSNPLFVLPTVYIPSAQGSLFFTGQMGRNPIGARIPVPPRQIDQVQFLVRVSGDAAILKAALRQAVRDADPSLWVSIQTIEEKREPFTGPMRRITLILSGLGGLVLVMASVGIYALLAYAISQRTREIGIRMALGARRREILSLFMQRTVLLIGWGIGLGLIGALVLNRILASVVPGTGGVDAVTCISVALLLSAVALLASYLPTRKALRVDPIQALRCE